MSRNELLDKVYTILVMLGLCIGIIGAFWYLTVIPMEECIGEGHSFNYCRRLLK
jgi:hypothetical protein